MHSHRLYSETGAMAVRKDHPTIKGRISKSLFNAADHIDVLVTMGRGGVVHSVFEGLLKREKLNRKVRMAVPSFAAAAVLVAATDCIACLPERVVVALKKHLPIRLMPLPFSCPSFEAHLFWHPRTESDGASRRFRDVAITALSGRDEPVVGLKTQSPSRTTRSTISRG